MASPHHHVRATDMNKAEIDALIAAENDPQKRIQLMILQSIHLSLVANTELTRELSVELQSHKAEFKAHIDASSEHRVKEEALLNKGRGAWMVTVWVLGAAQMIALFFWNDSRAANVEMLKEIRSNTVSIIRIEPRVTAIEKLLAEKAR